MICHRDKTFCSSSGTCANRECHRWLDFGQEYDLPVCMAHFRDSEQCPGYEKHQALSALEQIMTPP